MTSKQSQDATWSSQLPWGQFVVIENEAELALKNHPDCKCTEVTALTRRRQRQRQLVEHRLN